MAQYKLKSDLIAGPVGEQPSNMSLPLQDAQNPAHDLQRILASRLESGGVAMDIIMPASSLVLTRIDAFATQASRFAGPLVLALLAGALLSLLA